LQVILNIHNTPYLKYCNCPYPCTINKRTQSAFSASRRAGENYQLERLALNPQQQTLANAFSVQRSDKASDSLTTLEDRVVQKALTSTDEGNPNGMILQPATDKLGETGRSKVSNLVPLEDDNPYTAEDGGEGEGITFPLAYDSKPLEIARVEPNLASGVDEHILPKEGPTYHNVAQKQVKQKPTGARSHSTLGDPNFVESYFKVSAACSGLALHGWIPDLLSKHPNMFNIQ
jgi:hypothetical protein